MFKIQKRKKFALFSVGGAGLVTILGIIFLILSNLKVEVINKQTSTLLALIFIALGLLSGIILVIFSALTAGKGIQETKKVNDTYKCDVMRLITKDRGEAYVKEAYAQEIPALLKIIDDRNKTAEDRKAASINLQSLLNNF